MKKVVKFVLFTAVTLHFATAKAQTNDAKFIIAIDVEKTDTAYGVQGLKISYTFNFSAMGNQATIDSILNTTSYKIKTRIFISNEAVNPGLGYNKFRNVNNDFEIISRIPSFDIRNTKKNSQAIVFIPYSALKLPSPANYAATIKAALIGTVSLTDKEIQQVEKHNVDFYKPETITATVYVDTIEVTTLDSKGRAWDYSFFGKDYPDIGVDIKLCDNTVWDKYINNKFLFVLKANEKNYTFSISKNDKITILVEDRDLLISDLIEKFECSTVDKIKGQWYPVISKSNTVKLCKILYSIN